MHRDKHDPAVGLEPGSRRVRGRRRGAVRRISPSVLLAGGVLISLAGLALCAPWLASQVLRIDPAQQDLLDAYATWRSPGHLLGTDDLGRDVFVRVIVGGRVSLGVALLAAAIELTLGVSAGLVAGFRGGWVDDLVHFIIQLIAGVPAFFLLVAVASAIQPDLWSLALILGLLGWTGTCRQVRGQVLVLRSAEFVGAARAAGATDGRILLRHLLPHVTSVVSVAAAFGVAGAILAEAGLSFLGLGVQPPTPSWGNMLGGGLESFSHAPWLALIPGVMILATTLSVFVIADAARDAFDPTSSQTRSSEALAHSDARRHRRAGNLRPMG